MKVQVRVDFPTQILDIEASNEEEAILFAQKTMGDVPTLYGGSGSMRPYSSDTNYRYGIVTYPVNPIPGMVDLDDVNDCVLGVDISGAGASNSRDGSIVEMLMQLDPKVCPKSLELVMIKDLKSVEVTEDELENGMTVNLTFESVEKYDEDVVLAFKQLANRKRQNSQSFTVGVDFGSMADVQKDILVNPDGSLAPITLLESDDTIQKDGYTLNTIGDTKYEGKLELKNYATPTPDAIVVPKPTTSSYALLYNPKNQYIGEITTIEQLLSVRNSIKDFGACGYYLTLPDHSTIGIDRYGELERYPEGFFDEYIKLLLKLTDRPDLSKVPMNTQGLELASNEKYDLEKVQSIMKLCANSEYPILSNNDVNFHSVDYPPFPTQESTPERSNLVEKLKDIATSIITPMKESAIPQMFPKPEQYDPEGIDIVGRMKGFEKYRNSPEWDEGIKETSALFGKLMAEEVDKEIDLEMKKRVDDEV